MTLFTILLSFIKSIPKDDKGEKGEKGDSFVFVDVESNSLVFKDKE